MTQRTKKKGGGGQLTNFVNMDILMRYLLYLFYTNTHIYLKIKKLKNTLSNQ